MTARRPAFVLVAMAAIALAGSARAGTLDDVRERGYLQCGVNTGLPGFSEETEPGTWTGFDVDYCRAVAAAIFGDPDKVRFTKLTAGKRFTALQSADVDILARNTTWTMQYDTALGLTFAGVNYYDGQGFLVRKSLGITSALELTGARICVAAGTTSELNVADYFRAKGMPYTPVVFETLDEVKAAYLAEQCHAYTSDASGLYAIRLTMPEPNDHIVLPEVISKEPLGPVVRQDDPQWIGIAKWVLFALINAEEYGVTQANAGAMLDSPDASIRRLLGVEGEFGKGIGLANDWALVMIKAVGNYGEIFDRNIGSGSPLGIARGLNAQWTKGGILYAPPIR